MPYYPNVVQCESLPHRVFYRTFRTHEALRPGTRLLCKKPREGESSRVCEGENDRVGEGGNSHLREGESGLTLCETNALNPPRPLQR